jgi:hypothetical protein
LTSSRIARSGAALCGWLLITTAIGALASCSRANARLRDLAPSSVAVLEDSTGVVWALPAAAIQRVDGGRVTLAPGHLVTYCERAEGPAEEVAGALLALRSSGSSGGFGLVEMSGGATTVTTRGPDGEEEAHVEGEPWAVSGCATGESEGETVLEVEEILQIVSNGG